MHLPPKDRSRLNCIQLSQLTGLSLWAVRQAKKAAKVYNDNPFDPSGLCTLEAFRRWLEYHEEFSPSLTASVAPDKHAPIRRRELKTLILAGARKPPV